VSCWIAMLVTEPVEFATGFAVAFA